MQVVLYSSSLPGTSVTGVTAMPIGHTSARHQQDEADEVEGMDVVVRGKGTEATEAEEVDRMVGWPCWCSRNQQLQVLRCNQRL